MVGLAAESRGSLMSQDYGASKMVPLAAEAWLAMVQELAVA